MPSADKGLAALPEVGDRLGPFELTELVGRGGMGVVYRAHDSRLERQVALKVMFPGLSDEISRARFQAEARAAATVDHPNVVQVFDVGEERGLLFIASRYVDGRDLRTILRSEGPLDASRALALLGQVAGALDAAHERGVIHRDVKPANILVKADRRDGLDLEHAYIADFGIAKHLAGGQEDLTASGAALGTLKYAAPEQLGAGPAGATADVYSLSCVLFECLAGRPPYSEEDGVPLVWAHANADVPTIARHRPGLPAELEGAIRLGLAKPPSERPQSCGALIRAAAQGLQPTEPSRAAAVEGRRRWRLRLTLFLVAYAAIFAAAFVFFRDLA